MKTEQLLELIREHFDVSEYDEDDRCIVLHSRRNGVLRFERFAQRVLEAAPAVEGEPVAPRVGANCRGSYVLGSACRKCAKCEEELQRLISNACRLKSPDSDPVAEVVWHDPRLMHADSKRAPHKIIDASLAFFDKYPVGTKLYLHPQPSLAEKIERIRALIGSREFSGRNVAKCFMWRRWDE